MPTFARTKSLLAAALAAGSLLACGQGGERSEVARVLAAASLTDCVGALAARFEADEGIKVVASYDASNTLAAQIRAGAPPGVFLSASADWADDVERAGLAEPGSRVDLLGNALVVVVPRGAAAPPRTLGELADTRFDRIALADPAAVPAGRYAKAALEKAGVFDRVRGRVLAAQDVRTALAYVERGDVPVAIVYATDAAASKGVDVALRVAGELHPRIVYPMLLVKGASDASRRLHAFLRSADAWPTFERAGFTKP